MYVDDHEAPRTPGTEPGSAQAIMESFQRVLDALDAARTELHTTGSLTAPSGGTAPAEPLWPADPASVPAPEPAEPSWPAPDPQVQPLWSVPDPHVPPSRSAPAPHVPPSRSAPAPHVAPLWTRDTTRPERARSATPLRRARLVGTCGVGAVGGLLVVSSLLANGPFQGGEPPSTGRPAKPPHQDVRGGPRDAAGPETPEAPRRTYRIPHLQPGGGTRGYDIEVRAVAARFQGPPPTASL
ncbi:hypothetical protein [Streptomyces sp. NPDC015131]|uniref:hypothetical protein n=1 Tax=Streptomyces sp. NPDC015131 TaxID=3364941 RepID=UPI0036F55304